MILRGISINNFRVYDGPNSLSLLDPSEDENVYLVGGNNGAGKTSLFHAIPLAMYGAQSGDLVFQRAPGEDALAAYHRYLSENLSVPARSRGELTMSVGIQFENEGRIVDVNRQWWFGEDGAIDEDFSIRVDGVPVGVEASGEEERRAILSEFMEEIAPPGAAHFFFFDGEDIQRISERSPTEAVVDGLNQLLGFETLQRLLMDVRQVAARVRREIPGADEQGLTSALERISVLEGDLIENSEKKELVSQELARLGGRLESVDDSLATQLEGASFSDREELLTEIEQYRQQVDLDTQELQGVVADALCMGVAAKAIREAATSASDELEARKRSAELRIGRAAAKKIHSSFSRKVKKSMDPQQAVDVLKWLKESTDRTLGDSSSTGVGSLDQVSTVDLEAVIEALDHVNRLSRAEILHVMSRRNRSRKDLLVLERVRQRIDSGSALKSLLDEKVKLHEEQIKAQERVDTTERLTADIEHELRGLRQEASRVESRMEVSGALREELLALRQVEQAITEFMDELRKSRATELAELASSMMKRLVHKTDLVQKVEIDAETFAIHVYDGRGVEVLQPSAGEREVFSLSLIWALAQISGRELPFVIDTPLGRLDMQHRASFVQEFLPLAGDQVLVLSTDAEVDARWRRILSPHIRQEILIDFSDDRHTSQLVPDAYLELGLEAS